VKKGGSKRGSGKAVARARNPERGWDGAGPDSAASGVAAAGAGRGKTALGEGWRGALGPRSGACLLLPLIPGSPLCTGLALRPPVFPK